MTKDDLEKLNRKLYPYNPQRQSPYDLVEGQRQDQEIRNMRLRSRERKNPYRPPTERSI